MAIDFNILAPSVVTGLVSRIYAPGAVMQRYFGFEIGGRAVEQVTGRAHSWDLYDNVRAPAKGRFPGVGPATNPANPIGRVNATIARSYEKVGDISYEKLANIRAIGQNAGQRDRMGMAYLEKQLYTVKQRQNNFREFLTWGLLAGSCQFLASGDDLIPVLTGGTYTVDFKMPAGNQSQLNMLGAGSIIGTTWANAAADIPGNLDSISRSFIQLVGAPLGWVATSTEIWRYVLKNTAVQNQAGSVNTAFTEFDMTQDKNADGKPTGLLIGRIKAMPWLDWIIYDGTLTLNGTETRLYSGTQASFGIAPDPAWLQMVEGSEPVKESPWSPAVEQFGIHTWLREWDEPARAEIHSIQNALPENRIPKALAYGTVVF